MFYLTILATKERMEKKIHERPDFSVLRLNLLTSTRKLGASAYCFMLFLSSISLDHIPYDYFKFISPFPFSFSFSFSLIKRICLSLLDSVARNLR